jgi:hypothetical protein
LFLQGGHPPLEFNSDGSKKAAELKIVNLQTDRGEGHGKEQERRRQQSFQHPA